MLPNRQLKSFLPIALFTLFTTFFGLTYYKNHTYTVHAQDPHAAGETFVVQPTIASGWQYPVLPYVPGSFGNRTFFCCAGSANGRHLGEDVAEPEGTPIRAIASGVIKIYRAANGYGELVAVIEHDLGVNYTFTNGYGNAVSTRYILSIYGHLRKSQERDGVETGLGAGQDIEAGTVIGYVNDGAHNGDGGEHLHMGIRLSDAATAEAADPSFWFRGYELQSSFGTDFAAASVVIAQLSTPYAGYLDNVGCTTIDGWAWDSTQPNSPVSVDVYDGANKILSAIPADQRRPDLVDRYGNGLHGFSITTPLSLRDGEQHTVWVKITGPDHNLSFSPKPLTCGYVGNLDLADCNVIRGWAADTTRPNTSFNVSVYDGNTLVTMALANQPRSDVGAILGDNGLHGFNIPTPASLRTGSHNVSVKFESTTRDLSGSPKTISCDPSQTDYVGYLDVADCNVIRGWAADRNRLNQSINVGVYDAGNLIATVLASQSRSDVGGVLGDNGLHGFHIPTPASLKDGQAHALSVKFESSATNLSNGTRSITCPGGSDYTGYLDVADCNVIRGWAADRNRLNTSINVGIYDGGNLITTVLASQSRSDVGSVLGDNGLHGFNIATPVNLKNDQPHSLSVKFESSTTDLPNGTRSITCSGGAAYIGYLDVADCNVIRGWAADRNRLNTSINVAIYDGTNLVTTVPASQLRSDVGNVLGDNGLHGFNIATPVSLKNGQSHSIHVKFESTATELNSSPRTLSCSATDYIGYLDVADCNVIRGWAADRNRLNTSISVGIYDGASLVTTVPANQLRSDVGNVLGDNGLHGFNIATPTSLKNGQNHSVHVKFESTATELNSSPQSLSCSATDYIGYVDAADCNVIRGWAADRNRLNQSINVGIYDGNNLITTVLANQLRSDVGNVLGDNGLHGFNIATPTSLKNGQNHSVHVKFEASTSELNSSPRSLTCVNNPTIGSILPGNPPRRDTDQNVTVNGSGFQPSLTVTLFFPTGGSTTLSGAQIQNVNSNNFTLVVTLNIVGTYGIRVNNPGGGQSSIFNFQTLRITSISPSSPPRNNSDQSVMVNGSGFQPNLTVTVFFPGGGSGTLSGSQIQYSNSNTFTMIVTLNQLGQYNIRVNNPDAAQSELFSFSTQ